MNNFLKRWLIIAFGVFCLTIMSGASLITTETLQNLDIQNFEIEEARKISTTRQLLRVIPVYNHADEKEFALYDYGDDGFILMHRETGTILEQVNGRVPFSASLKTKKYYLGIGNYFEEKESGGIINYSSGKVFNKSKLSDFKDYVVEFTNRIKEQSQIKTLAKRKRTATLSEPIFPGEGWVPADAKNIYGAEAIAKMIDGDYFGYNTSGSCVAVSHNILLQFEAKIREYAIMPQGTIPDKWINKCLGYIVQGYDTSINSLDSIGEAAHKYLIRLSNTKKFGIGKDEIKNAMETYINELPCVNMQYTSESFISSTVAHVKITNLIDQNRPVAIVIDSGSHSVVAYGYTAKSNGHLRVHYGWSNKEGKAYSDCYVNENLVSSFSYIGYVSFPQSNHTFQATEITHQCVIKDCFAAINKHNFQDTNNELHTCNYCKYTHSHNYVCTQDGHECTECNGLMTAKKEPYDNSFHKCEICGKLMVHEWITLNDKQICVKCLEIKEHDLTQYTYIDDVWHKKACADSGCTYSVEERHNKIAERVEGNAFVHNERCQNCSYHKEAVSHTITTLPKDSSYHHQACICGYVKIFSNTPVAHTFKWDSSIFKYRCTGCGYIKAK